MPELHELHLSFHWWDLRTSRAALRALAATGAVFPKLADLQFSHCIVDLCDLRSIILAHSSTLKAVEIRYIKISCRDDEEYQGFWMASRDTMSLDLIRVDSLRCEDIDFEFPTQCSSVTFHEPCDKADEDWMFIDFSKVAIMLEGPEELSSGLTAMVTEMRLDAN